MIQMGSLILSSNWNTSGVQWDLNTDSGYLRVYSSPIENITEHLYILYNSTNQSCDDTAKTGSFTVLVEPIEIDSSSGSLYQRFEECYYDIIFNLVVEAQNAQVTARK